MPETANVAAICTWLLTAAVPVGRSIVGVADGCVPLVVQAAVWLWAWWRKSLDHTYVWSVCVALLSAIPVVRGFVGAADRGVPLVIQAAVRAWIACAWV